MGIAAKQRRITFRTFTSLSDRRSTLGFDHIPRFEMPEPT